MNFDFYNITYYLPVTMYAYQVLEWNQWLLRYLNTNHWYLMSAIFCADIVAWYYYFYNSHVCEQCVAREYYACRIFQSSLLSVIGGWISMFTICHLPTLIVYLAEMWPYVLMIAAIVAISTRGVTKCKN